MADSQIERRVGAGFYCQVDRHGEIDRYRAVLDLFRREIPSSEPNAARLWRARQMTPPTTAVPTAIREHLDADHRLTRPAQLPATATDDRPVLAARQAQIGP